MDDYTDYHVHLTVPFITQIPKGWKKTVIVLDGSKEQTDIMLTRHFRVRKEKSNIWKSIREVEKDMPLIRIKIEQDSNFYLPITTENYIELHAKCLIPAGVSIPSIPDWVRSRNSKEVFADGSSTFFYNKRIYEPDSLESIRYKAREALSTLTVKELKIEQIVYDSNAVHDSWWVNSQP